MPKGYATGIYLLLVNHYLCAETDKTQNYLHQVPNTEMFCKSVILKLVIDHSIS